MSTSIDYIEFVMDSLHRLNMAGMEFRYLRMFGEYCVYANDKPIILVCNNTVHVKMLECLASLMSDSPSAHPYPGSKLYYVLDVENSDLLARAIVLLEANTSVAKRKKKSNNSPQ